MILPIKGDPTPFPFFGANYLCLDNIQSLPTSNCPNSTPISRKHEVASLSSMPSLAFDDTLLDSKSVGNIDLHKPIVAHRFVAKNSFEELYAEKNSVILSKNGYHLQKTFRTEFPIENVLWCHFESDQKDQKEPAICILGKSVSEIHTADGSHMSATLEIDKAFPTSYGLFIERKLTASEKLAKNKLQTSFAPFCFTLSHPLHEFLPVIYRPSDKRGTVSTARYITSDHLRLISIDVASNLLFCYDTRQNCHSIWIMRKATDEDALSAAQVLKQNLEQSALSIRAFPNTTFASAAKTPQVVLRGSLLLQTSSSMETPSQSHTSKSEKPTANTTLSQTKPSNGDMVNSSTSDSAAFATCSSSALAGSSSLAPNTFGASSFMDAAHTAATTTSSSSAAAVSFQVPLAPHTASSPLNSFAAAAAASLSSIVAPRTPFNLSLIRTTPNASAASANRSALFTGGDKLMSPAVSRILSLIRQKQSNTINRPDASPFSNFTTPSIKSTPRNLRSRFNSSLGGATHHNATQHSCSFISGDLSCENNQYWQAKPLIPDICLDHLWSETIGDRSQIPAESKASKAQICEDFCGQKFYSYFVPKRHQLRFAKLAINISGCWKIASSDFTIHCKDVAFTSNALIIVVLDPNGDLVLYTGCTKICYLQLQVNLTHLSTQNRSDSAASTRTLTAYSSSTPAISRSQPIFHSVLPNRPSFLKTPTTAERMPCVTTPQLLTLMPTISPVVSQSVGSTMTSSTKTCIVAPPMFPGSRNTEQSVQPLFQSIDGLAPELPYCILTLNDPTTTRLKIEIPQLELSSQLRTLIDTLTIILPKEKMIDLLVDYFVSLNKKCCPNEAKHDIVNNNNSERNSLLKFFKCLADFVGFDTEEVSIFDEICSCAKSPLVTIKKMRITTSSTDDEDWKFLQQRKSNPFRNLYQNGDELDSFDTFKRNNKEIKIDSERLLFPFLPTIFFNLHCCYENMKLSTIVDDAMLLTFAHFLYLMASSMDLSDYLDHYERDFSELISLNSSTVSVLDQNARKKLVFPTYFSERPFCFFENLLNIYTGHVEPIFLNPACDELFLVWTFCNLIAENLSESRDLEKLCQSTVKKFTPSPVRYKIVEILDENNLDFVAKLKLIIEAIGNLDKAIDLYSLPAGILLSLLEKVELKSNPNNLLSQNPNDIHILNPSSQKVAAKKTQLKPDDKKFLPLSLRGASHDGMADLMQDSVLRLRFSCRDQRLRDVRRMLRSSKPTKIPLKQQLSQNDHEFREEQEHYLLSRCIRSLMLPTGRGMFTLRSCDKLFDSTSGHVTHGARIPKLCMTGKSIGQNLSIEMTHIEVPANCDTWPQFHNGVAAGLKIFPRNISGNENDSSDLVSAWIVAQITKPTDPNSTAGSAGNATGQQATQAAANNATQTTNANANLNNQGSQQPGNSQAGGGAGGLNNGLVLQPDIAGFLLGLGLNGMLSNLDVFNVHKYLSKGDPMTSIALLLGMAASKAESRDPNVFKVLVSHLPFLLPPTLLELNVDAQIQNAAVLAMGVLYARSSNYRLAESLLKQLRQPSSASTDHMHDREAYALSCGLALGFILLGRGNAIFNDPEFTLADELILLINGGYKKQHHRVEPSVQSNLVKEGEFINIHMTSLPATVALGLMFLKTNDERVAYNLAPPETMTSLDTVRPDFLLMRTLCRNLIMWDHIVPNRLWVEQQVPEFVLNHLATVSAMRPGDFETFCQAEFVDFETLTQAYCYITVGACFSIGFKFAGSANAEAFDVLMHYCKMLMATVQNISIYNNALRKAGKYTLDTCLSVVLLSLGMVMANTGNLDVIRVIRLFRKRLAVGANYLVPNIVLGLLFFGGGKYNLKTDDLSIAAMLCAFYPKFPCNTNDNRYHLQAFRHMYVLACERRTLLTVEAENDGEAVYCDINVVFKETEAYCETSVKLRTPCSLPEFNKLQCVEIIDSRYFPFVFSGEAGILKLKQMLNEGLPMVVKRKAGWETREFDPSGYKSIYARTFMETCGSWIVADRNGKEDGLTDLHDYCSQNECMDAYPILSNLEFVIKNGDYTTRNIWQLKILKASLDYRKAISHNVIRTFRKVICKEWLLQLCFSLETRLVNDLDREALRNYIGKWVPTPEKKTQTSNQHRRISKESKMAEFLTYFDVMNRKRWSQYQLRDYRHLRSFVEKLRQSDMPIEAIVMIQKILLR